MVRPLDVAWAVSHMIDTEGHTWSRWSVDDGQLIGAVGDRALKSEVGEWRHESVGVSQDTESELAACWGRYRGHLRSGVKTEPGAFHLHAVLLSDGVPRTTGR